MSRPREADVSAYGRALMLVHLLSGIFRTRAALVLAVVLTWNQLAGRVSRVFVNLVQEPWVGPTCGAEMPTDNSEGQRTFPRRAR